MKHGRQLPAQQCLHPTPDLLAGPFILPVMWCPALASCYCDMIIQLQCSMLA